MDKGQEGEDFVNKIAYNSFLKFWCFPGPLDITKDNKEICDLLIFFNNTLILVSVKNYDFGNNYKRYFNRTTNKAIKQLLGAERLLFGTREILLKHPDRSVITFPKEKITKVFRIVVNLNTGVKCYRTSFCENGKHISVMDAEAWMGAIKELNTIPDFIKYLEARNKLFDEMPAYILPREEFDFDHAASSFLFDEIMPQKEGLSIILGTELDLIATYIKGGYQFDERLNFKAFKGLHLRIDGQWEKFKNSDLGKEVVEFEKEGSFIEYLLKEVLKQEVSYEPFARMLFSLNKIERSIFKKHFMQYHSDVAMHVQKVRYNRTHYVGLNLNMVFVYFMDDVPIEELKPVMNLSLWHHAYLHDFKVDLITLLGVSESLNKYLFGYLEPKGRPEEDELNEMVADFREFGWLVRD